MKKIITFILMFTLFAVLVNAQATPEGVFTQGTVKITILNAAPSITELLFSPAELYADSELKCDAKVWDDQKGTIVAYNWYKNGWLLEEKSDTLSGFEEKDKITCTAVPQDIFGKVGKEKSISTTVKETTKATKAAFFVMNKFGTGTSLAETAAMQEQGLTALTGYVVSETVGTGSATMFFIVLVGILLLITLNMSLRRIIARQTHKY